MKAKFILVIVTLLTVLSSCNKETGEFSNLDQTPTQLRSGRTAGRSQSVIDISQTREKGRFSNPYYIGTIRAAYTKLKSLGQISPTYNISPNALYVRYLPKDENDFYLLESTSPTELFEYPLQENDIQNNEIHHYDDGTLSDGQLPFQYTVCTIGQVLTGFEADILDTLFLNHLNPTISDEDWRRIEAEALISTGVIDPNNQNDVQAILFCDEWFPSGKIQIWDDALATNLPLKQVKIKVSKWYQWITVYTNNSGDFTTFPFLFFCGKVKYSIIYENPIWDIRDGKLGQADTQGPTQKTSWNHVIKDNKKSLGFGTVHRSLFRYFFDDVAGLRRPFVGAQKLKVSYRHENGNDPGDIGFFSPTGFEGIFYSHVHIFGFLFGEIRPTQGIFSTTTHELAHVAHAFQMGNIQFWQVSNLIVESWARACQWKITELEYGYSPLPVPGPLQNWPTGVVNNYSPLFIDLEDSFNQNPSNISGKPLDVLSGYNLSLIQTNVLGHSYGLSSLRNRLKSQKPSGVTDAQIDANLQFYFDNF